MSVSIGKTWLGPLIWTALLILIAAGESRSDVLFEEFEVGAGGDWIVDSPRGSVHVDTSDDAASISPGSGLTSFHLSDVTPKTQLEVPMLIRDARVN